MNTISLAAVISLQKLGSGLAEHQESLRDVCRQVSDALHDTKETRGTQTVREDLGMEDILQNWEMLSKSTASKKRELEENIKCHICAYREQEDRPSSFGLETHLTEKLDRVRQSLLHLRSLWKRLEEKVIIGSLCS